jgi:hypothetical protein
MPVLVPIVEGHAKVKAVPVLIRRLLAASGRYTIRVVRPVRVKRYKSSAPASWNGPWSWPDAGRRATTRFCSCSTPTTIARDRAGAARPLTNLSATSKRFLTRYKLTHSVAD